MKGVWLFCILFFSYQFTSAQYWMQRGGGNTIDEGIDIATDASNNTYTTGYFTSTANFDSTVISSAGLEDIFMVKTDSAGYLKWIKREGGINIDRALSIDADAQGNTVVTGYFVGTSNFSGQTIISAGQQDIFIAKYNSAGNLLWIKSAGGTGNDAGNAVSFDKVGNVIVTGEFSGSCSFGSNTLISQGGSIDIFTAKYDSNGNQLWAKKGSAKYTDRGTDVSVDTNNNIYVTGMFSDTITFDNKYDNPIYNAMFIVKYNSAGVEQWVRWMGSGNVVNMGGISVQNNEVNITGNFIGTLYFFGNTSLTTLSSNYSNNIFICKYDSNGNIIWKHSNGSDNDISAESIAQNSNGEISITGNFKCRLSEFSLVYGEGVFCSVGYSDTYVSSYDNAGNWLWARQSGGQNNDFAHAITILKNNTIVTTGSFQNAFNMSSDLSTLQQHGQIGLDYSINSSNSFFYCSDNNYGSFNQLISHGNSDVFINANYNLNCQPYDFFQRSGIICDRSFKDICIGNQISIGCQDTVEVCDVSNLSVNLNMISNVEPSFNYLWSDGSQASSLAASNTGQYSVTITSIDGCFSNQDTVFSISDPSPPIPTITDSKGINSNAINTVPVSFCIPDSVSLNCTNPGSNSISWSSFILGQNPIIVGNAGSYSVTLTNQFGCSNENFINIITSVPLQPIQPQMRCIDDLDNNDTIQLCKNQVFTMLLYDQLTNPLGVNTSDCVPEMTKAKWFCPSTFLFNDVTQCNPNDPINTFVPKDSGTFTITISAWIIRENACDTDSVFCSKNLTVIVFPIPSGSLSISVSGPTNICPGDTLMLIASPSSYNFQWSTGETNDTIFIYSSSFYSATAIQTVTNSFGCIAGIYGSASISVNDYPQPIVTMIPTSGLICPNDSIKLICSGSGSCSWQSPMGVLQNNNTSIFVNIPGYYYCIQTVGPGCELVSNTQQVIQYNTPFLFTFPEAAICNNESIEINIVTNFGSTIQWDAPLFGINLSQLISTPGIYNCTVNSCNIVTPLSITIHSDSAIAEIYSSNNALEFCEGDSLTLFGNSGMTNYLWLPNGDTSLTSYATQSGNYILITTSKYGCKDSANISLTTVKNNLSSPTVTDTSICPGDSLLFITSVR